jgi:hypothetical protein
MKSHKDVNEYYREWKNIKTTDVPFYTYIYFREKGGSREDMQDIFPLETFFERSGKLNLAQVYL